MLHAAVITLLNVLVLSIAMFLVGRARGKHGIRAPAILGNEDFERVFRAHQNTIEQTVLFLPTLWVASYYHPDSVWVMSAGYAWIIGRVWYIFGYRAAARQRGMGFAINLLSWTVLFVIAAWGVYKAFVGA